MNIESISDYISMFKAAVTNSGFARDVTDFKTSLPTNQGNIVTLREIANKILASLNTIYASDLPEALVHLFPNKNPVPFTAAQFREQLQQLVDDKAIKLEEFFPQLQAILNKLDSVLTTNVNEVNKISEFIKPYVQTTNARLAGTSNAIFAVIFKDKQTVSGLKHLSRTLVNWNRILPLYHQLITRTSPEEIEIVDVQNGSIELLLNLDAKVALSFAELFKVGLLAFGAYIAHKKMIAPLQAQYFGSEKLAELDRQKENLLLENIREAVASAAKQQQTSAADGGVAHENPDKVIQQVTELITAHIVRGNQVKLLALPKSTEVGGKDGAPTPASQQQELADITGKISSELRALPESAVQMLLENYSEESVSDEPVVPRTKERKSK
jgi:hypothetical protein